MTSKPEYINICKASTSRLCSAVACEFLLLVVAKVTCAAAADVVVVGSSLPATTAVQQQLYQQSATGPTFIQGNKQRYCSTVLVSLAFNTCRARCPTTMTTATTMLMLQQFACKKCRARHRLKICRRPKAS